MQFREIDPMSASPVTTTGTRHHNPPRRVKVAKRVYDVIVVLVLAPLLTLPAIFTAIAIKSQGLPLIFRQWRGLGEAAYEVEKFTTMTAPGPGQYTPWICKLIRIPRFDEIPQLLQILKGIMSVIGPRYLWTPEAEDQLDDFQTTHPGVNHPNYEVEPGLLDWSCIFGSQAEQHAAAWWVTEMQIEAEQGLWSFTCYYWPTLFIVGFLTMSGQISDKNPAKASAPETLQGTFAAE